jgi:hypothetical protein
MTKLRTVQIWGGGEDAECYEEELRSSIYWVYYLPLQLRVEPVERQAWWKAFEMNNEVSSSGLTCTRVFLLLPSKTCECPEAFTIRTMPQGNNSTG